MGSFAKLIDEGQVGRVTLAFEETIAASFETHKMRHMTTAEVKRRFEMCARIFEKLRGELKWGIERILDTLPTYLGCELDGKDWASDAQGARTIWAPGDGR